MKEFINEKVKINSENAQYFFEQIRIKTIHNIDEGQQQIYQIQGGQKRKDSLGSQYNNRNLMQVLKDMLRG